MDILYLLDRLEEVLGAGTRLPFNRTMVDEQECMDILDQIRVAVPEEIKAAHRVTRDRDQILAEAQAAADRLVREADERAAGQVSSHSLVRAAEVRSSEIEEDARRVALEIRREADQYAFNMLTRLQKHLAKLEGTVTDGLRTLQDAEVDEEAEDEISRGQRR